eukprot:NODE_8_length_66115_cov_0.981823.p54 type:complete len:132 gc:universal NODE_8_length_66115_cov_0.981823:43488-43883(+)
MTTDNKPKSLQNEEKLIVGQKDLPSQESGTKKKAESNKPIENEEKVEDIAVGTEKKEKDAEDTEDTVEKKVEKKEELSEITAEESKQGGQQDDDIAIGKETIKAPSLEEKSQNKRKVEESASNTKKIKLEE